MKLITGLILFKLMLVQAFAQSSQQAVKIPVQKSHQLVIYTSAPFVLVEGYAGDEVLVKPEPTTADSSLHYPILADNRASADSSIKYEMKPVSGPKGFLYDGLQIYTKCRSIKIQIPNHLYMLSLQTLTQTHDGLVKAKNYDGPVRISSICANIEIENLSGPFNINNEFGKIMLKHILWNASAKWPFSNSPYGEYPYTVRTASSDIQLFLPGSVKASFYITRRRGKVYTNLPLGQGFLLNNGGIEIALENTATGNIYINRENN